jgi:hypothetical protein
MRPADWPPMGRDAPWKVRHVNVEVEELARPHVAQIDVMHANGGAGQSSNVPTSWVDVGTAADFPREGGAAIMHGQSQIAVFNFASRGKVRRRPRDAARARPPARPRLQNLKFTGLTQNLGQLTRL